MSEEARNTEWVMLPVTGEYRSPKVPGEWTTMTIVRRPPWQPQALINGEWVDVDDVRFRSSRDAGNATRAAGEGGG